MNKSKAGYLGIIGSIKDARAGADFHKELKGSNELDRLLD